MMSSLRAMFVVAGLAFLLAGCGVRGGLETPAEAKAQPTADAQSGEGKAEGAAPKPHKPFILDGLLR
ncbi:LPS translocon maturation chaperone LptM [Hyphomicrobium sp.]|uniref:LPS translocon maturation chaperone LptM n=1 Tax=Hyphomicrobium sp. TaxID=82 RepID=UPI003D0A1AE7